MRTPHPTFTTAVPAYYMGRPRSAYDARFQRPRQVATASTITPASTLARAA